MTDSNATYNTSVAVDMPDYASSNVTFTNLVFFTSGNNEIFPGKQYVLTLGVNGTGTQVLPCPDNDGTTAVNWRINLPSRESGTYAISYSASTQQLSDILASQSTTTDPDSITASLATKANKVAGATADNLASLDADGDLQDTGLPASDVTELVDSADITIGTPAANQSDFNLTVTGVSAGTHQATQFTIDANGRITTVGTSGTLTTAVEIQANDGLTLTRAGKQWRIQVSNDDLIFSEVGVGNGLIIRDGFTASGVDLDGSQALFKVDLECTNDSDGLILKDRTTATRYRLYVNNGSLSIEAA